MSGRLNNSLVFLVNDKILKDGIDLAQFESIFNVEKLCWID